jgi:diguanylate cyclase (GGDEF)-like protein/PAS domain S-box-containing protein
MSPSQEKELERLRFAISVAGDAVYDWDLYTGAFTWSDNALDILGATDRDDIVTKENYFARIDREDREVLREVHERHFKNRRRFECEYRVRRDNGEYVWVHDRGMAEFDPNGKPIRIIGAIRGVASNRISEAQLARLANYDDLTGQFNRSRLREALRSGLAYSRRHNTPGAYLIVGIDNLTLVNYTHGQDVADRAILSVSRVLDSCLRASDVVGSVGPDQFGVVLNGCAKKHLSTIAEKILEAVQQVSLKGQKSPTLLSVSIGAVTYPDTVREAHDAMAKAEVALDRSQRSGHNCFTVYDLSDEASRDLKGHVETAEAVQTALKMNRLGLAFQPIVDAKTQTPVLYECLLRMRDEYGDWVQADGFIPVAEQMGLARPIDRRVLEMVVEELSASPGVSLALNMSVLSTTDPAWLRLLTDLLKERPGIARSLLIEITETAVLEDVKEAGRFVAAVREMGCRVALDDFGAGYTSFRHLQEMAVDMVKIDGSFVKSLVERVDSRLFVRTLQTFASGMGLKTVAECVESEAVANILVEHGVDYLQGYYFGRPELKQPWLRETEEAPTTWHMPPPAPRRASFS